MNTQKFTQKSQEALLQAQNISLERNSMQIEQEHLLAALLRQDSGLVPQLCVKMGVEPSALSGELDEISRKVMQLEIEEAALKKENDKLSAGHLADIRRELAELRETFKEMKARWENEKSAIGAVQKLREELEQVNAEIERAERAYDLNKAAQLKYGRLPPLTQRLAEEEHKAEERQKNPGERLLRDRVTAETLIARMIIEGGRAPGATLTLDCGEGELRCTAG